MQPLIINLAPTGMVPTKEQTPYVPLTPEEIFADVSSCIDLGVSMVHLHARDLHGRPTEDIRTYQNIISLIRNKHPEVVIITTTSGRIVHDVEKRASTLYLEEQYKPDMASLTLGSMNFSKEASVNSPQTILRLAEIMKERGIKPELEVFDLGMIHFAKILIEKNLIEAPYYFNILLGNPGTAQLNLLHLATIVNDLPPHSIWSLGGIGRFQLKANALGIIMGNGVRVGLEDNLWLTDERTQLARNTQLVERITEQANILGRPIATARQTRQQLGLLPASE
ncbi:3-keto-5-aminohexanoate cleavage protein [Undibacterium sp. SXout7W]|uniref:3-keto-5-aminohexanoate cleavage protein n=1 Tax=Undibacterium sp. SXout7W TaxID=3413049 RepID=UPI003BF05F13